MTKESLKSDIFHILYTEKEKESSRDCEYLRKEDIIKWIEYENKKAASSIGFNKGDILKYKDRSTLYLVYDMHTRVSFGEYGWDPNDYVMRIIPVEVLEDRLRSTKNYYTIAVKDFENYYKVDLLKKDCDEDFNNRWYDQLYKR